MANAIHFSSYSSIKKRFTVMKKQTSKKSMLWRSFLLLPLLILLLYGFGTTVQIPKQTDDNIGPSNSATEEQLAEYNALAKKYYELPTDNIFLGDMPKSRSEDPKKELQTIKPYLQHHDGGAKS